MISYELSFITQTDTHDNYSAGNIWNCMSPGADFTNMD